MRKLRRGPLLVTALVAAVGGAAIYLVALPPLWRMSWPYGVLVAGLGAAQFGTAVAVLTRPVRRRVQGGQASLAPESVAELAVEGLWRWKSFTVDLRSALSTDCSEVSATRVTDMCSDGRG